MNTTEDLTATSLALIVFLIIIKCLVKIMKSQCYFSWDCPCFPKDHPLIIKLKTSLSKTANYSEEDSEGGVNTLADLGLNVSP